MPAASDTPRTAAALETLFAVCFRDRFNTILMGGGAEPLYQPADHELSLHRIVYRQDFVASALHEVAHWCVAGRRRRELVDYGYWYEPDGRTVAQQAQFERVEVKPQALEWVFADAWGSRFELSADNVAAGTTVSDGFARAVLEQKERYLELGLPERAARFSMALAEFSSSRR